MVKNWKTVLGCLVVLLLFLIYLAKSYGYSFFESKAIRESSPNIAGQIFYEESYQSNKKLVVWDTGNEKYLKLIEKKFLFLYRQQYTMAMDVRKVDSPISSSYYARLIREKTYGVLFGTEIRDSRIKQVIVIDRKLVDNGEELKDLEKIRELSTVYVELEVVDDIAFAYAELEKAISFAFLGLDSDGKIIFVEEL